MKKREKYRPIAALRATTLSETLVVMILAGIVLLSVFDGLSLFEQLLHRFTGRLERSMERMEAYYRLESLFTAADSARQERPGIVLYRDGAPWGRLTVADSLLTTSLAEAPPDTLLRQLTGWQTVAHARGSERVDSLILRLDTTTLRLGIGPSPHRDAVTAIRTLEKQYLDED